MATRLIVVIKNSFLLLPTASTSNIDSNSGSFSQEVLTSRRFHVSPAVRKIMQEQLLFKNVMPMGDLVPAKHVNSDRNVCELQHPG